MRIRNVTFMVIVLGVLAAGWAGAGERGAGEKKPPPPPAPPLDELTLTEKITKQEHKSKGKDGLEQTSNSYFLELSDGTKVSLPAPPPNKPGSVTPDSYVGKSVTLVGMGTKKTQKQKDKEVTTYSIKSIRSITEKPPVGDEPAK